MTGVRAVELDRTPEVRHAAPVLVVAHGRTGTDLLRELGRRCTALSAIAGRPLEISAVHSVTAPLERAVLGAALRMVDSVRPEIVVEAVDDAEAAVLLVRHALRRGASVVTASAALLGTAGPSPRALAADCGRHFLLVADGRHARAGQALVADLAARGVATRACRLDPRHRELHLITERTPDPVLARALRDLEPGSIRTEAVAGGWTSIGTLLR